MNQQQAEQKIIEAGGDIEVFHKWMCGQTCPVLEDGSFGYYEYDVDRFIRYKFHPKNEPTYEFD